MGRTLVEHAVKPEIQILQAQSQKRLSVSTLANQTKNIGKQIWLGGISVNSKWIFLQIIMLAFSNQLPTVKYILHIINLLVIFLLKLLF